MGLSAATRAEIERHRDRYPEARSAILPCLWAVQNEIGHLTAEGMAEVAAILHLAPSEVQAVSTFYSMYFDRPGGRHHVIVCINVSCALRGSDEIVAHLEQRLGCASGGTTADGEFTWESTVECLGACGGAPAMQVDHRFHEDLTVDRVDAILQATRATAPVHGGSAVDAPGSAPHPSAAETPPMVSAEGRPADVSVGGASSQLVSSDPAQSNAERPKGRRGPPGSRRQPRQPRPQP